MHPISIVFTINFTFLAIWGLLFTQAFNRPELIPLFLAFQTVFNLFFMIIFFLDRRKNIAIAFAIGFAFTAILTIAGYMILDHYVEYIRNDEMITS
jgi:hypothetical protein